MPLTEIQYGTLADPQVVNDNFTYLENRITDTVSKIYTNNSNFESSVINLKNYLEGSISVNIRAVNTSIDNVQEFANELENRIDDMINNPYPTPEMTPLIDWETMAFKANVGDVRIINNTTTGIKAYGGDYSLLNYGDIYLKEDFTNYPRIMVIWTDDGGSYYQSTIWESWNLDFLLSQSKGVTSILGEIYGGGYYWQIQGYQNSYTVSGQTFQTNKKYFWANSQQNCAIVEIYGLDK